MEIDLLSWYFEYKILHIFPITNTFKHEIDINSNILGDIINFRIILNVFFTLVIVLIAAT